MKLKEIQKFVEILNRLKLKTLEILKDGKMEHLHQLVSYIATLHDFTITWEMLSFFASNYFLDWQWNLQISYLKLSCLCILLYGYRKRRGNQLLLLYLTIFKKSWKQAIGGQNIKMVNVYILSDI